MSRGPHVPPAPAVSVLIPAYDAEDTIAACLASVRRQSFAGFECVVVDDGSSDDTGGVVERLVRTDPRVRLVAAPHRGLVAALNVGLERCRGRYVARMDADDLMHRRRLERQLALLHSPDVPDAVGCHVRMFPRAALGPGTRAYERWLNGIRSAEDVGREAFVECPLAHPTLVIRRELLAEIGGYRDLGWPEDYDLLLRLLTGAVPDPNGAETGPAAAPRRVGVVPQRLLAWRHRPDRLSRTAPAYRIERFVECKAAFLAATFLAGRERYVLWGYGGTGRRLARALRRHGRIPSHIVEVHSGRLGQTIAGAEVVPRRRVPSLSPLPLVVSVAGAGPRNEIRAFLHSHGLQEQDHYICAA